ncbi:MAG TPA: proline--tRNA ligase [Bryobacteraceae bacterium]|jgi:prolyl-tRNA synthetase|nr:proline--tRNA ligase [Bryobacteraceae bacterium]
MLWSKLFIPTLRETPAEAEVPSHQLLLRAGYIRQLAAGIYSYLFLAQRSLLKIQQIVRSEMDAMGAQEFLLPALNPAEVWQESGRWDVMGDNMFRLKDRFGRDLCLGMTHEEIMTVTARGELRSYKQLPQIWYQIQTKFRDEPRPKSGLLRVRQFLMKDSYSFDMDAEGLDVSFRKHYEAYRRIFARCGLDVIPVEADSGAMGGSQSMEFMVASDAGEDLVVNCPVCRYAANLEKAVSVPTKPSIEDPETEASPEEFHTPGRKTIAEVSEFTHLPQTSQMKSLVMVADGKPVLALLRGDHQLSETKFAAAVGATTGSAAKEVRTAHPNEINDWFGADPGSLGPIGITNMPILADVALQSRRNMIAGANKNDHHLRNVTPGRDFKPSFFDIRQVSAGDVCTSCGATLELHKTIEIGHIFKLGYKYSDTMGLRVLAANGAEVTPIMGSYGIGIERILTSCIEQNHDDAGMALPAPIAPFAVIVTPVNNADAALRDAARRIYEACLSAGIDALYDDRDERPGVKFKDADLIGVPYRVTVGKKLAQGAVELATRKSRSSRDVPVADVVADLRKAIDDELAAAVWSGK